MGSMALSLAVAVAVLGAGEIAFESSDARAKKDQVVALLKAAAGRL
jgi:hypothetical protein